MAPSMMRIKPSAAQRVSYANDPGVLLAVSGPLNEQKGDSDAASWLPPNRSATASCCGTSGKKLSRWQ